MLGHLFFIGFLCYFLIILLTRIWLGYLFAQKNKLKNSVVPIEIPNKGQRFIANRFWGYCFGILTPIYLAISIFVSISFWHSNKPNATIFFWLIVDLTMPITLLFLLVAIKGFRSYIAIDKEGFEYRDMFRTKRFPKTEIEEVCRDNEFIFVKCVNKRLPVIIDRMYGHRNVIYEMLCTVKQSSIENEG